MKKKKMIPFEVIEKAVEGEPEAIQTVLQHYNGYIKYLSMYQGNFNSDIQEHLQAKLELLFSMVYILMIRLKYN